MRDRVPLAANQSPSGIGALQRESRALHAGSVPMWLALYTKEKLLAPKAETAFINFYGL